MREWYNKKVGFMAEQVVVLHILSWKMSKQAIYVNMVTDTLSLLPLS